jgi:hypothetical protein
LVRELRKLSKEEKSRARRSQKERPRDGEREEIEVTKKRETVKEMRKREREKNAIFCVRPISSALVFNYLQLSSLSLGHSCSQLKQVNISAGNLQSGVYTRGKLNEK